jgi:hypothetical protein
VLPQLCSELVDQGCGRWLLYLLLWLGIAATDALLSYFAFFHRSLRSWSQN